MLVTVINEHFMECKTKFFGFIPFSELGIKNWQILKFGQIICVSYICQMKLKTLANTDSFLFYMICIHAI